MSNFASTAVDVIEATVRVSVRGCRRHDGAHGDDEAVGDALAGLLTVATVGRGHNIVSRKGALVEKVQRLALETVLLNKIPHSEFNDWVRCGNFIFPAENEWMSAKRRPNCEIYRDKLNIGKFCVRQV